MTPADAGWRGRADRAKIRIFRDEETEHTGAAIGMHECVCCDEQPGNSIYEPQAAQERIRGSSSLADTFSSRRSSFRGESSGPLQHDMLVFDPFFLWSCAR
jgi:hypothetical protein